MPQIIPIRDLKNTSELSKICHQTDEPVFVTKNGYGDLVVMSMEAYEKSAFLHDVYAKLEQAEQDVKQGRVLDARSSLAALREKHGL